MEVAERIRLSIAYGPWPQRNVTASLGIAATDANTESPAVLVEQADRALYQVKQAGRDRSACFGAQCSRDGPGLRWSHLRRLLTRPVGRSRRLGTGSNASESVESPE
jgi:hypothetical protein